MTHVIFMQWVRVALLTSLIALSLAGRTSANPLEEGVPVSITGELTILYMDDFENKRAELQYFIEDKQSKKRYRLQFKDTPSGHLRTGMTLTARGKAKGKELLLAADGISTESTETLLPSITMVAGEQRALVMVGDFNDLSVACSVDEIRDIMFTDSANNHVDALYQEMSQGAVTFSGDVSGPYTIDYSSTDTVCDTAGWASALDAAAMAQGFDLSTYTRRVYVLPSENSCGGSGLGTLGGDPSRAWVLRCDVAGVYSHELGHNLGMNHASTPTSVYGDTSDGMGSATYLRKINAPHQEQMGWVPAYQIVEVTQSGTHDIAPLAIDPALALAPQMLKIAKPDTLDYYYLSYRQPLGFDTNISPTYHNSISIHTYTGDGSASRTFLLEILQDGESYTDGLNGLSVSQVSHTSDYVTVEIQLDAPPPPTCSVGTPQVSLSPSSQSASAGAALNYIVSITNNDDSNCADSTFVLNGSIPADWTASLSPSTLSLAPGLTGTASLTVTSSTTAAANIYGVGVNATDSSEAGHTVSGSASYTVLESCTTAAPGLILSPSSQSGDPGATLVYTLSVTNKDSIACGINSFDLNITSLPGGWNGSLSSNSLSLASGATGMVTVSVASADTAAAGSYNLQVGASDAADSTHADVTTATYMVNDTTPADDTEPDVPLTVDLTGASTWNNKVKWEAVVVITVDPVVDGALVSGSWSDGSVGSCMTDSNGVCDIMLSLISRKVNSVTFTVESIAATGYSYMPADSVAIDKP